VSVNEKKSLVMHMHVLVMVRRPETVAAHSTICALEISER
jgi:hypothetical protein